MSNFQDSSWHVRFSQMGDASERKFEEWAEGRFERWGINRPENLHVPSLPPNVRAAPDYITNEGFVECMGVGRGQQLKLKLEKYAVLTWWNHVMPLRVWVWDSHKKRSCIIALADLDKIIQTPGVIEVAYFDDRKLAMANTCRYNLRWLKHASLHEIHSGGTSPQRRVRSPSQQVAAETAQ